MPYPITPQMIKTDQHFYEAFGNMETETSARLLVKFAQSRGGWFSFTKPEIDAFSKEDFWFNRLSNEPYPYIVESGGRFHFTHQFIATCFRWSPAVDVTLDEGEKEAP